MNPATINSTTSVSTTRRKREAERSVNWTLEETQVLLCAWSDERVQKSLAENLRNRHVFKHLSARMSETGFCRSPHQCRLRVKTLKANYVRAKLQRSVDGSQPCTFKYFTEMDAVLGRRADGGGGGAYWTGERHLNSTSRTGSTPPDLNCSAEVGGRQDACSGRRRLSWSEERGGAQSWLQDSEVKVEDGDVSTDEFEFSNPGRPQQDEAEGHLGDTCGSLIQNRLSSPLHLVPPPLVQSVSPPPPAPPDPLPSSNQQHPESTCLEPVLRHLSQCFQALVSETRGLLVQLESQRQEQARWHQELLAQWLQREEQRQREAAEREERRERARMEHEIRVLELLGGLAKTHSCERGGGPSRCGDRDGD